MYKCVLFSLLFSVLSLSAQKNQPVAVGNWRVHLNYQNVQHLAEVKDKIYCASSNGLFVYKKDGGNSERLSPINGFSGYDVSALAYNETLNTLIIAYSDGTVELLQDNTITQNQDILRKTIIGSKKVNHINIVGKFAWFSTAFGLLEFNIEKNEFRNSYLNIGPNGTQIEIMSSAVLNDTIFVSTRFGIMKGSLSPGVNLSDYNNWTLAKSALLKSNYIAAFHDHLVTEIDSQLFVYRSGSWSNYENGSSLIVTNISVQHNKLLTGVYGKYIITEEENGTKTYKSVNILNDCMIEDNGVYWYASPNQGLVLMNPWGGETSFYPNGPRSTDNFSFVNAYDRLYCSAGSFSATTYSPAFNANRYYSFDNFYWSNSESNPIMDTVFDITHMAFIKNNGKLFMGSHTSGLIQFNNGTPVKIYNNSNSPLKRRGGIYCIISGLAVDKNNNLWVSNFDSDDPLLQLSAGGVWTTYKLPVNQAGRIILDSKENKWIITPRTGNSTGIVFFSDKNTATKADDITVPLSTNKGSGNLPSNNITALAFTKGGELLVGSDQGYGRIRTPNNILTGGNYDFDRIIVSVETGTNLGGYLLGSEYINCITLDGGDRRWVGTNNGAWLIADDGETILQHFTMENSPLLSNNVNSIGISDLTGEVFFGTDKGIVSYRSDALKPSNDLSNVKIFPNPVRPEFEGDIAITGLEDNTLVKITDINGRLVYQTNSNGGMATWNCKTFDGTKVATGVYLAFCINEDGSEQGMGKILFIK